MHYFFYVNFCISCDDMAVNSDNLEFLFGSHLTLRRGLRIILSRLIISTPGFRSNFVTKMKEGPQQAANTTNMVKLARILSTTPKCSLTRIANIAKRGYKQVSTSCRKQPKLQRFCLQRPKCPLTRIANIAENKRRGDKE